MQGTPFSKQEHGRLSRRAFMGATMGATTSLLATPAALAQRTNQSPVLDVPYVPTPQEVVDRMLALVQPTASDFVMDLGCGDGRMLVTAASKFGARGFGVDLNPVRIEEATANARKAQVADKIKFEVRNLFETSIKDANILTMYLLPSVNIQLRPRILDEMQPGSRIVSHAFHMGDWQADVQTHVNGREIYHWIVPAKINGKWKLSGGGLSLDLTLEQKYQTIAGRAESGDMVLRVQGAVRGSEVVLLISTPQGVKTFSGKHSATAANMLSGEGWSASKI